MFKFMTKTFLIVVILLATAGLETKADETQEEPYVASNLMLNITPGMTLLNSAPAWGGIAAGLSFPLSFPLYLGVETGYYTSVVSIQGARGSTVVKSVPILLTSRYIVNATSQALRFYLGASAGVNFVSGMGAFNISGLKVGATGEAMLVELSVKPGFEIILTPNIQITLDTKIGLLGDAFLLSPGLGIVLSI